MKNQIKLFLALMAVVVGNVETFAASYTLFSNGNSKYSIVVRPQATACEQYAAKELQSYIQDISGAKLAISSDVKNKGKHIYVGYNATGKALEYGTRQLGMKDVYSYVSKKGNIYIYGNTERATMYGVFSFLEDIFDVRWFAPGVTRVPKRAKYSFENLSKESTPEVAIRQIGYKELADGEWCAHNKVNGNYVKDELGGCDGFWNCHTAGQFMPPSQYFATHPEYYALRDGKRVAESQPCLSNPEVLKIMTAKILEKIAANPGNAIYDMSQNDNQTYCTCDKCTALVEKYGGQSGIWIWFVNQLAREVKKKYPNKYIGTFAYYYTRKPPVGIVPDDNVVIRLCSIECCFMHSLEGCSQELNKAFLRDIKAWASIAPHLYIWDYVVSYSQYLAPFPNFNVLGPNIKTFAKYNAIGIYEEAQYQTKYGEFSELRSYVLSKLLWDPSLDVNVLVEEFINGFYGGAASYVMQYYKDMQGLVGNETHTNIYPNAHNPLFTDTFITNSMNLLDEAKKHCNGQDELNRIERLWLSPAYLYSMRNKEAARQNGTYEEFLRIVKRDGIRINEPMSLEQFMNEYNK